MAHGPTGDRGVGASFTGMVIMPGDFNVRSRSSSTPTRSEVIMVTVTTLASLVLGGVTGWWVFGHAVGVVLGILGLLGFGESAGNRLVRPGAFPTV